MNLEEDKKGWALLSGGKDSTLAAVEMSIKNKLEGVVYIDTGIGLNETTLELFTKKVQTRLNQLKILKELSDGSIINWESSSLSSGTSPKIYPGDVIKNLKESYNRSSVTDRAEQRYGHIINFLCDFVLIPKQFRCLYSFTYFH